MGFLNRAFDRSFLISLGIIPGFALKRHWFRDIRMHIIPVASLAATNREPSSFQVADEIADLSRHLGPLSRPFTRAIDGSGPPLSGRIEGSIAENGSSAAPNR